MRFKTPKTRKKMTDDQYLKSVYYRNRKAIIEVFGRTKTLQKFKNAVEARKVMFGLDTKEALKKLSNTEAFTPKTDRFFDNLESGLKEYNKLKEFKNYIRDEKGRFSKYDRDKLKWDKELKMYVYDDKVYIDVKNSPKEIDIGLLAI